MRSADKNLMKFSRGKCKVLPLRRITPRSATCWGLTGCKATFRKKTWGPGGQQVERESWQCVTAAKRPTASWDAWEGAGQERWSLPANLALVRHSRSAASSSGLHSTSDTGTLERVQWRTTRMVMRRHTRKGGDIWDCLARRRGGSGGS